MFVFLFNWFLVLVGLWTSWTKTKTLPNLRLPISSGGNKGGSRHRGRWQRMAAGAATADVESRAAAAVRVFNSQRHHSNSESDDTGIVLWARTRHARAWWPKIIHKRFRESPLAWQPYRASRIWGSRIWGHPGFKVWVSLIPFVNGYFVRMLGKGPFSFDISNSNCTRNLLRNILIISEGKAISQPCDISSMLWEKQSWGRSQKNWSR